MSYLEYRLNPPVHSEEDRARTESLRREAIDLYQNMPIEHVWEMAHFHPCFKDDTPVEFLERHAIFSDVAREMVRLHEWRSHRPEPTLPVPQDPAWVWGTGDLATYTEVQARYPGILAYFQTTRSAPRTVLWDWVSRYNQWAALERDLKSLQQRGEQVQDWSAYEERIRHHLERVHLGLAEGDFK